SQGAGDHDLAFRKNRLRFIATDGFRFYPAVHSVELGARNAERTRPGRARSSKREHLRSAGFDLRQSIVRCRSTLLSFLQELWPLDAPSVRLHAQFEHG